MPKSILESFESFGPRQPVGNTTSFALDTSSGFRQVYDMQATSLFPQMFYTKPVFKPAQPDISSHVPEDAMITKYKNPLEDSLPARVFMGSMTIVGLFIFYRCVMRGI